MCKMFEMRVNEIYKFITSILYRFEVKSGIRVVGVCLYNPYHNLLIFILLVKDKILILVEKTP